jgi:hypothetical protein
MPKTSLEFLATGFCMLQNVYFVNGSFFLVEPENASDPALDVGNWIKERPGAAARDFGVSVVPGWEAVCNASQPFDSLRHIESAIMITDFIPQFEPHLYHMLENMLGVFSTLDHFLQSDVERGNWPEFLVLPQNNQQEFGSATVSLIRALFPRTRIMDQARFRMLTKRGVGLHLKKVVASDRSGADHGGINQMLAGISSHLPGHTWKMSRQVCLSCRAVHPAVSRFSSGYEAVTSSGSEAVLGALQVLPVVTFVDRQSSGNRRLDHTLSRKLFYLLSTRAPWLHFQWIRFETLSFCEQVQVAHSSSVLFGVHGNGLSHVLWMSRPGALIEIFPGSNQRMLAFQQFAEAVELLYFGLDSGTGEVYREGSCQGKWEGGTLLPGCAINGTDLNTIVKNMDVDQVVCLVCQALVEAGLATGLPPCAFCGPFYRDGQELGSGIPSCASAQREILSRSAPSVEDFERCYHKGANYTCEDLRPRHVLYEPDQLAPSDECLGGGLSWGTCRNGEFLCREGSQDSKYRKFLRQHGVLTAHAAAGISRGKVGKEERGEHRLCIVLPFRDGCSEYSLNATGPRTAHLRRFLSHMRGFFHGRDFDFILVHQTARGLFNRALLFNIGANVAESRGCDFVALHDIDRLPLNPDNSFAWPSRPIHLCTNTSDYTWAVNPEP